MAQYDTHDRLTRHLTTVTSIAIDQNGQSALTPTNYHTVPPYSGANNIYHPPSSEYDNDDKKPVIEWSDKIWSQNSKLSPSDVVRTATPSANSTESTPSSQRHSIGPDEADQRPISTPEIKSEFSDDNHGQTVTETNHGCPTPLNTSANREASSLLLSLAQSTPDQKQLAALRIEEKILHEKLTPQPEPVINESTALSIESVVNSVATVNFDVEQLVPQTNLPPKPSAATPTTPIATTPPRNSRAFFRPPGHGGPTDPVPENSKAFICSICNFSCPSKFHYNSHMNTHGDHQCSMCDYTSRTEGRLKKHMRESHTREEQIAAGLDVPPEPQTPTANAADFQATMASLMEAANRAVSTGEGDSGTNSPVSSFPSALDSIRALTEGGQNPLANLFQMNETSNDGTDAGPSTPREPPRRSSGGKQKQYTCKQCSFVSTSKEESWRHNRSHIPPEKQLSCKKCEFVTEYKHHLEYHIRNHYGSKPFKCNKCNYSCVNKSMLNSHMKSHSNEYQFQCMDCSYQSKYCHSLKMHLRKYSHRRKAGVNIDIDDAEEAMLNDPSLEEDGSVHSPYSDTPDMMDGHDRDTPINPPPASSAPPEAPTTTSLSSFLPPIATTSSLPYANLFRQEQINELARRQQQQQQQQAQNFKCSLCEFTASGLEQFLQHHMMHVNQNQAAVAPSNNISHIIQQILQSNAQMGNTPLASIPNGTAASMGGLSHLSAFHPMSTAEMLFRAQQLQEAAAPPETAPKHDIKMEVDHHPASPTPCESINGDSSSLERSSTSPMDTKDILVNGETSSIGSNSSQASSRKRKATSSKLEEISQRLQGKNSPEQADDSHPLAAPIPIPAYRQGFMELPPTERRPTYPNNCEHCKIGFEDEALYNIHRGYHGYDDPMKCNRCGETLASALHFNIHLWRVKHD